MTVLHVIRHGEPTGAPLLAIHGVTGHARRWDRLARDRWAHRNVIAPDLRGHGHSTWEPPWSIEQMVDDLLDTLDHLDVDTVDVVGHSFGGALAVHLLARAPERIGRMVLLDPGFHRDPALIADEAEALLHRDGWSSRAEAVAARNAGWLVSDPDRHDIAGDLPSGDTVPRDVADEIDNHLTEGSDGRFRFRFGRPAVITVFGELSRPVPTVASTRPTLLVIAASAGVVTPTVEAALLQQFGDDLATATLECGHMVFWERFEETADLVGGFLEPAPLVA